MSFSKTDTCLWGVKMKHDAFTGVICINTRHFKLNFSRSPFGISQFLLAPDCHIKLKNFVEASFILIFSKRHQFGWPSSEGINNQAVVLRQVEATDFVHARIQRGDRGQDSGHLPLLKNSMCKGFLINKQWPLHPWKTGPNPPPPPHPHHHQKLTLSF